ncbi:PA14 domain-containing protein [Streptomyces sp. NPDC049687]|uniref:fibronectin type III domain-containing protein n=1 Tax=Streptomyces sp. NPDC049687 TaxID=3365596 RepID=UPI00378859F4
MNTALRATAVVLATTGGLLTAVTATAEAATTCASPVYKRQFYANTSFSGTPGKTDCDSAVDENWGTRAPASGLPTNNFGVRWTVTRDFGSGGPFALSVAAQDGIRVYVDGVRKIDVWRNVSSTVAKTVNLTVPKGKHTLRVDYVNWTGAANVKFTYTPRTSAAVDKVKPLTPLDALVSYDTATNRTKLTWTRNREMDLAGYRVYRRLRGSTSWTKVATTTAVSHTDTPPATGALYYYEVRAYDRAGNESAGTADAPVTSIELKPPAGYTAAATDTGAELSWWPVAGAVRYRVERTDGSGVTKVWDVTDLGHSDSTIGRATAVTYRVAAVDGSGHVSPYTESRTVSRPPATPRGLTATGGVGSVTLRWTMKPEDAPYTSFRVYRSKTLPVTTATAQSVLCTTAFTQLADGSRQYSCGDYSVEEGTTYHYAVAAVEFPYVSALSGAATVTTLSSDKAPAPVTGLTATATEYGIELDWAGNTEDDLYRYVVYRGQLLGEEGDEQVCSASEWAYLNVAQTAYTDVTLPDGDRRCYFVDARDQAGNSSFKSTGDAHVVVVDELDLTPSVATPEGSPLTVTATEWDGADAASVHLSWNEIDSATGYDVLRWNPATEAYEKLATTSDRWYFDTTAARGTTHYYWVTAHYADGTDSAPGADHIVLEPGRAA